MAKDEAPKRPDIADEEAIEGMEHVLLFVLLQAFRRDRDPLGFAEEIRAHAVKAYAKGATRGSRRSRVADYIDWTFATAGAALRRKQQ